MKSCKKKTIVKLIMYLSLDKINYKIGCSLRLQLPLIKLTLLHIL